MKLEYTIRHRTLGDVGAFGSMTAATMQAIGFAWPLEEWDVVPVETPAPRSVAPFADLRPSPKRDRALDKWARS